ncbi:MAG: LysR family transcriptional regulator [Aeromicrobium sp.]|uniref:LysR family transcriptional regulator n=1 Tax=Aeromicrobium sp. TaxID=1871063 RepID=UPI0025C6490B|nr:LysR family transcriptional regulator [Aeromicrobium sp.]MCK5891626.1 LysR family transcriptional regulator [Aeromicrobium sp.]MDF1704866.1 LysR family transcriptional regulator [Aeromicrobium sp.]
MLNPVHLRTLTVVLRTGSFADAGRRLGYTGSAVSQQISALERQVRMPLFERSAHAVRPTPAAEFIAARATSALSTLQELEDEIAALHEGTAGRVRLGSFPTAAERLLPIALSELAHATPDIEVHLDEGEPSELVGLVEARELDVALVYRYDLVPLSLPRGLRAHRLLVEDLLVIMPVDHPAAESDEVVMSTLAAETWITTRDGTAAATMMQRLSGAAGFEPDIAHRSNDYDVIHGLVRAGLGLAVVPALGHVPTEGIAATRLSGPDTHREVFLLRSPTSRRETVTRIVAALEHACETVAAGSAALTTGR